MRKNCVQNSLDAAGFSLENWRFGPRYFLQKVVVSDLSRMLKPIIFSSSE